MGYLPLTGINQYHELIHDAKKEASLSKVFV